MLAWFLYFSVHKYVVAITTGSLKDSGTEHGQVSVCLIGVNGDTGTRRLTAPITKHRLPWQPGQEDIFIVEAVSVGKLKKVEVNFSSPKSGKLVAQTLKGWLINEAAMLVSWAG